MGIIPIRGGALCNSGLHPPRLLSLSREGQEIRLAMVGCTSPPSNIKSLFVVVGKMKMAAK